jgi:hypothetical protein
MDKIMKSDSAEEAKALGETKIKSRSINTTDVIDFYFNSVWEKRSVTAMKMLSEAAFE